MELLLIIIAIIFIFWIVKTIISKTFVNSSRVDDYAEKPELKEETRKSIKTKIPPASKTLQQQILEGIQDKLPEENFKYKITPENDKSDILSEFKGKGVSEKPKKYSSEGISNKSEFTYEIKNESNYDSILDDFKSYNAFKVKSKLTIKNRNEIRDLKATEFEDYIAQVYAHLGYLTYVTSQSSDGGVDVIAKKKGKEDLYIQCKGWKENVGVKIVREMAGIVSSKKTTKAIIITTSDFTNEAKKEALEFNVELINFIKLIEIIDSISK